MRQLKALFLTRLSVVFLPHNSIYLYVEIVQLTLFDNCFIVPSGHLGKLEFVFIYAFLSE